MEQHNPLINYEKEAFSVPANLGFMTIMLIVMAVTFFLKAFADVPIPDVVMWLIPLLTGMVEMFYLALMPQNTRFVHAVNARYDSTRAQVDQKLKNLKYIRSISPSSQKRYGVIYDKKMNIMENLSKRQVGFLLNSDFITKLETLEGYYLERLFAIEQFQRFMSSNVTAEFTDEIKRIQKLMESASPKVKAEYQKRIDVLQKRIQNSSDHQDNFQIANIQAATLEDTFELLQEQVLTVANPEMISNQIDYVLTEAEQHQSTIKELENLYNESDLDVSYMEHLSNQQSTYQ